MPTGMRNAPGKATSVLLGSKGLLLATHSGPTPSPVLAPSPMQDAEDGFSSRPALSIAARPRGCCPCLRITSRSPAAPFPCPSEQSSVQRQLAPVISNSRLSSSPSHFWLQSHWRVLKEEEIFQQCLCSFRNGLK